MEKIMPEGKIYIPRPFGKHVSIVVGNPITNLGEVISEMREQNCSPMQIYKAVTDIIQGEMEKLEKVAQEWHERRLSLVK
jgi:hypothetical protein